MKAAVYVRSILSALFFGILAFASYANAGDLVSVSKPFGVSLHTSDEWVHSMQEKPDSVVIRLDDKHKSVGATIFAQKQSSIKDFASVETWMDQRFLRSVKQYTTAFAGALTKKGAAQKSTITLSGGLEAVLFHQEFAVGSSTYRINSAFSSAKRANGEAVLIQISVFNVTDRVSLVPESEVVKHIFSGIRFFDYEIQAIAQN